MIKAALIAALLQNAYCVNSSAIVVGSPAPCSGVLMAPDQAREALQCKRVELPKLKAQATFEASRRAAIEHSLKTEMIYLESVIADKKTTNPWWVTPLVGAAFLGIGYAVGSLTGGTR